jgi:hypothetical protein
MDAPEIKPLNPRLSPKLDVFLGGSDQVNQARAVQCPSVWPVPRWRDCKFRRLCPRRR